MTNGTRQVIQYVAIGLYALFTLAILSVFVFDEITARGPDGIILAYVGAVLGTITGILGVNVGSSTATSATRQANENTAAVVAAAKGIDA